MKNRWIIAANSCKARVLKIENNHACQEVDTLVHCESRVHTSDLYSERLGRTHSSVGPGRSAMEPSTDPKKIEADIFAKDISHYLSKLMKKDEIECIYIAASPSFLGNVRQHLTDSMRKLVKGEVDKDITHLTPAEILKYFVS